MEENGLTRYQEGGVPCVRKVPRSIHSQRVGVLAHLVHASDLRDELQARWHGGEGGVVSRARVFVAADESKISRAGYNGGLRRCRLTSNSYEV